MLEENNEDGRREYYIDAYNPDGVILITRWSTSLKNARWYREDFLNNPHCYIAGTVHKVVIREKTTIWKEVE